MFTFAAHFQAKVAQLVEHHLAKVGVASSNLVFRSQQSPLTKEGLLFKKEFARVVVPIAIGMVATQVKSKKRIRPGGGPDSYRDGSHAGEE